jgi:2-oxoglutarate dehydrogenase E1 component
MLLPHGYEGQGPEHSNAYLERFLQLCAKENIQVCNVTTPAQYFHLLRRQATREVIKPLIIMTPKSLLRYKSAVSPVEAFTTEYFREVLDDDPVPHDKEHDNGQLHPSSIKRVLLCSGKIYYELVDARREKDRSDIAIIRVEQFYPYPRDQLEAVLKRYSAVEELFWVQEEPRNRGGWTFMLDHFDDALLCEPASASESERHIPLRYIGRPATASPATGSYGLHAEEQRKVIDEAIPLRQND